MTPLKAGVYIISGASKEKNEATKTYYAKCYYYLHVVDKVTIEGLSISNEKEDITSGDNVIITVLSDLPLSKEKLKNITIDISLVATGEERSIVTFRDQSIPEIEGSARFTQKKNRLEVDLKNINSGKYIIRVFDGNEQVSNCTKTLVVQENKVIDIEGADKNIRRNKIHEFKAKLKNTKDIKSDSIRWRIVPPKGDTYAKEYLGEVLRVKLEELGKYKIQCKYGSSFSFSSPKKKEVEVTVIDNKIETITVTNAKTNGSDGKSFSFYIDKDVVINIGTLLKYSHSIGNKSSTSASTLTFPDEASAQLIVKGDTKGLDPILLCKLSFMPTGENTGSGEVNIDGGQRLLVSNSPWFFLSEKEGINMMFFKEGIYFLSVKMGSQDPYEVMLTCSRGIIKQWEFTDIKDRATNRLGFWQSFRVNIKVEGLAKQKVKIHFWEGKKGSKLENYSEFYDQEIELNEEGICILNIKADNKKFWQNLTDSINTLWTNYSTYDTISLYFTLTEIKTELSNMDEKLYKRSSAKHVYPSDLSSQRIVAEISSEMVYDGYFANADGDKEIGLVSYGKKVTIKLWIYFGFKDIKDSVDRVLELYENKLKGDRFVEKFDIPCGRDTLREVILDTSKHIYSEKHHETDKGSMYNPRLFYFILKEKESNRILYIYPFDYNTGKKNDRLLNIKFIEELGFKYSNDLTKEDIREISMCNMISTILKINKSTIENNIAKEEAQKADLQKDFNFRESGKVIVEKNKIIEDLKKDLKKVNSDWQKNFDKLTSILMKKVKLTPQEIKSIEKQNEVILLSGGDKYLDQLKVAKNVSFNEIIKRKHVAARLESSNPMEMVKSDNGICECEAKVRAFMRMIKVGEGTGELIKYFDKGTIKYKSQDPERGYNIIFNGVPFTDMSKHPEKVVKKSSAAGAYQITQATWWWTNGEVLKEESENIYVKSGKRNDDKDYVKNHNIKGFDKESQDMLCVVIMKYKQKGLLDLIINNKIEEAILGKGSNEWASLPKGNGESNYTYDGKKQATTLLGHCLNHYNTFLEEELKGVSNLHIKKGFLKEFGYDCCTKVVFNAKDVVTYRIYHDGRIEKHIPKVIKEGYEKKYMYVYHDEKNIEHILGTFNFKITKEMNKGNIVGKKDIELIDVREFNGYNANGVKLKFLTLNTDSGRYFINPDCYAGLLGAMAKMNVDYLGFNGFSDYLGQSVGGSSSHLNGEKGDLRYLSKNRKGEATLLQDIHFDVDNQNNFNNTLYLYGWGITEKLYSEEFKYNNELKYKLNHTKHMKKEGKGGYRHHHHIHLTGFDFKKINKVNEK